MNERLVVVLNGESQLEYRRDKPLPARQREYLDKMDRDMDTGITLGGSHIVSPTIAERAQFVAINLIDAVRTGNEPVAAAMCAYLANRLPDLKQVKTEDYDGRVSFDLVFDEPYVKAEPVRFVSRDDKDGEGD